MTTHLRGASAALVLLVLGCSDSEPGRADADAALDKVADAAPNEQPPIGDCRAMQRDYVNAIVSPDEQVDVATTVAAVLQSDFPQGMSYCSGEWPEAD